jgi:hypothetical protein
MLRVTPPQEASVRALPLTALLLALPACNTPDISGDEGSTAEQCSDATDNDDDGFTDCADQGCLGVPACIEGDDPGDCDDGDDNDLDGWTDCDDQDCWGVGDCAEGDVDTDTDSDGDTDADTDTDADADAVLYINELLASNWAVNADGEGEYDDWFELYNPNPGDFRLDGFSVTANLESPGDCPLPDDLVVPAEGWLLLWADSNPSQGDDHVCFNLARSGGAVGLTDPDGQLMDAVEFGEQTTDVSLARHPDGGADWVEDETPTPGAANR